MGTPEMDMQPPEIVVKINPSNRRVDIRSEEYQQAWQHQFTSVKQSLEDELKHKVESGEITLPVDPDNHFAQDQKSAIRFSAHAQAEQEMQSWAMRCGIGLPASQVYDHGTVIRYIEDGTVPPLTYEVVSKEQ